MEKAISETLDPLQIKNKEFKKVVLGYCCKDVIEFLDKVARTWDEVRKNEKILVKKIEELNTEIDNWKKREKEIEEINNKAKEEAKTIIDEAHIEAEKILKNVEEKASGIRRLIEEWLMKIIGELEETQRKKRDFVIALKSSLDSHYRILEESSNEKPLTEELVDFLKKKEVVI